MRSALLLLALSLAACGGPAHTHEEVLEGILGSVEEVTRSLAACRGPSPSPKAVETLHAAIDVLETWQRRADALHAATPDHEEAMRRRFGERLRRTREAFLAAVAEIRAEEEIPGAMEDALGRLDDLL